MKGIEPDVADLIERINAMWFTLDFFLVSFLIYYLISEERKTKNILSQVFYPWKWWNGETPLYLQLAIAILVFTIGDLGVRYVVWALRHQINKGGAETLYLPVNANELLVLFSLIAGFGILCKIRVFSDQIIGKWLWITAAVSAMIMATITRLIP